MMRIMRYKFCFTGNIFHQPLACVTFVIIHPTSFHMTLVLQLITVNCLNMVILLYYILFVLFA